MVKPVFKTRNQMREAASAEDAFQIGINFLKSADALRVSDSDAGTFAKDIVGVFQKHEAPELLTALLEASQSTDIKLPFGFRASMASALVDFNVATQYQREAKSVLTQNAKILQGTIGAINESGLKQDFSREVDAGPYADISAARDANALGLAVNSIMYQQDIPDSDAEIFLGEITRSFRRLNASQDQQLAILTIVVDASGRDDKLYELALAKSVKIIDDMEGPSPQAGDGRGLKPF